MTAGHVDDGTRELQEVFLGEVGLQCLGQLVGAVNLPTSGVSMPIGCTLHLGRAGMLIATDGNVTTRVDPLDEATDDKPFVSQSLLYLPWSGVAQVVVDEAGPEGNWPVTVEADIGRNLVLDAETAFCLDAYHDRARVAAEVGGHDALEALETDIGLVLAEHGFLDVGEVVSALQQDHGWESVDGDAAWAVLAAWWSPPKSLIHAWFLNVDKTMPDDATPLELAISARLLEGPASAADMMESLKACPEFDYLELDDVYDALYDPTLPFLKRVVAWFVEDSDESETGDPDDE